MGISVSSSELVTIQDPSHYNSAGSGAFEYNIVEW